MTTTSTPELAETRIVQAGWAPDGTLVIGPREKLFKVVKKRKIKYLVVDEDGREWTIAFQYVRPAPAGAVFAGPEVTASQARDARLREAAANFRAGDIVRFKKADPRTDGRTYLVVRQTSPGRFKLQEVGGEGSWRTHATLIEKV